MEATRTCVGLGLALAAATAFASARADTDDTRGQSAGRLPGVEAPAGFSPRYIVTYFKSRTDAPRSAAAITVLNDSGRSCDVIVQWRFQATDEPACTSRATIGPRSGIDFCSRGLLSNFTTCGATCSPELGFTQGKAVVLSTSNAACTRIALDARQYYFEGTDLDSAIAGVTGLNVVPAR